MRIVFISAEYPLWKTGGVGTFLQTFGRVLVQEGHTVIIVGTGTETKDQVLDDQGVVLYRLKKNKGILPNFLHNAIQINKKLKALHRQDPIDIIESAELGMGLLYGNHPAKKVIRLHGGHHFFAEAEKRGINKRKGALEKRSFKKTDAFIAVSQYVKNHTANYLSYYNKPIQVINNLIDTTIQAKKVNVSTNRILFAGTVCEKKGIRQLIEALKIVRKQYPQIQLDVFGRDWFFPDGSSYINFLKDTYDDSFLEAVVFHGPVDRKVLNQKYAEALFCVFPSHMETQGLVSLEAMLLEKPVIFSKYGPGPETITHGETGLLCDVYQPEDIAKQMIYLIEHPKKGKAFGIAAAKVVRKKYDPQAILDKNLSFYKSLLH